MLSLPGTQPRPFFPVRHASPKLWGFPWNLQPGEQWAVAAHPRLTPWTCSQGCLFSDSPVSWQQPRLGSLLSLSKCTLKIKNIYTERKINAQCYTLAPVCFNRLSDAAQPRSYLGFSIWNSMGNFLPLPCHFSSLRKDQSPKSHQHQKIPYFFKVFFNPLFQEFYFPLFCPTDWLFTSL